MTSVSDAIARLGDAVSTAGLPATGRRTARISIGDESFDVSVSDGDIETRAGESTGGTPDFGFSISAEDWDLFCSEPPPRGYTSAQAMVATIGQSCLEGDRTVWASYATVLDRVLEVLREQRCGARPARHENPPAGGVGEIVGRYALVQVSGRTQRIYYEAAGEGPVLLCLHTAGSDSRQFRYLMEDAELTSRFRVVAFDMPWHGRSDPPDDWATTRYALTTDTYAETVLGVMDALGLDRPVLVGCSMGGAIALYLASRHGDRFRGVCALEGGLGNPGRFVPWTNHIEVDHSHFLTSWVGGLIAPSSPTGPRSQTLWGYAQSGPGVYQGDTYFYSTDFPQHSGSLAPASCPLWVFSGEYDYSATTEMSRDAAQRLGGELVEMKGSGHFPMAEDPVVFRSYLVPVLDRLCPPDENP